MKIGDVLIDSNGRRVKVVEESCGCEGCVYLHNPVCDPMAERFCSNDRTIYVPATNGELTEVEQLREALDRTLKEASSMRKDFNDAINFAIKMGAEGFIFLEMWREGDENGIDTEFPAFREYQARANK